MRFRKATRADISAFYPEFPYSFRAIAGEKDGELMGLGGVYYTGNHVIAFSVYKPEMDKYPIAKGRAVKKIMEIVREHPCIAIASDKHDTSMNLLSKLGFTHIEGRVFEYGRKR